MVFLTLNKFTSLITAKSFSSCFSRLHLFLACLMLPAAGFGQNVPLVQPQWTGRVAFYNVENFFDIDPDTTREYNGFTPEGEQHWDLGRFLKKKNNVYKVLMVMGEGEPPVLVGLCEVENESVLLSLIYQTPLENFGYQFVHYESADRRGIDVAIIYRKEALELLTSAAFRVVDPDDAAFRTRDILYASFKACKEDTMHVFVNHWPSRYGGELATTEKRMLATMTLRSKVDSISRIFPHAKVLIMGDFNDTPGDISLTVGLKARPQQMLKDNSELVNLFSDINALGYKGTIKHLNNWQVFDQIIVSLAFFNAGCNLVLKPNSQRIFAPDFLLVPDEKYLDKMLYRTFVGPRYVGGYSDHLPVYVDVGCATD